MFAQTHIRQQLGFVNREKRFDRLQFQRKTILNHQIQPEATIQRHSFVDDRQRFLSLVRESKIVNSALRASS
jgi:hypothetical protein